MVLQIMILVIIFTMMVQIMIGEDILGIECKCRPGQKFLIFQLNHIIVEQIHQVGFMELTLYLKETLLTQQFVSITVITFVSGQVQFRSNIVEISFCITWKRQLYVIWDTVLNKRSYKTLLDTLRDPLQEVRKHKFYSCFLCWIPKSIIATLFTYLIIILNY